MSRMRRVEPAPPRGRYDRSLHSEARHARQHERLLQATTHALGDHGEHITVSQVVASARVGRNTFYEHFADLDTAVDQAAARGVAALQRRLRESLTDAWTPLERLRNGIAAWLAFIEDEPFVARALLRLRAPRSHAVLTRAGEPLRDLLRDLVADARRDAVLATTPDELRLIAVTAAVEAIGRRRIEQPWIREDGTALAVDLVVRACR